MIDPEPYVFDRVARAVLDRYPNAYVTSRYVEAPPQFPAVMVTQPDSSSLPGGADSSLRERFAVVTFKAEVCSNSESSAKSECKEIISVISEVMAKLNMTRRQCGPAPNAADPSIYRMTARFTGVVGEDEKFYTR